MQWPAGACWARSCTGGQPAQQRARLPRFGPHSHFLPRAFPSPGCTACSVYELYCDYVLKNPFHEMDQVIKSELFDQNLLALLAAVNRRWGVGLPQ